MCVAIKQAEVTARTDEHDDFVVEGGVTGAGVRGAPTLAHGWTDATVRALKRATRGQGCGSSRAPSSLRADVKKGARPRARSHAR